MSTGVEKKYDMAAGWGGAKRGGVQLESEAGEVAGGVGAKSVLWPRGRCERAAR
jgi:hypothetical protein